MLSNMEKFYNCEIPVSVPTPCCVTGEGSVRQEDQEPDTVGGQGRAESTGQTLASYTA